MRERSSPELAGSWGRWHATAVFALLMAPTLFSSTTSPRGSLEKKAVAAARAAELELVAKPSSMEEEAVED